MGDAADAYFIIAAGVAIVQIRPPPPPPPPAPSQTQSESQSSKSVQLSADGASNSAADATSSVSASSSSRKAHDRRFFASLVSPSIAALALPPNAKTKATMDAEIAGDEILGHAQKSAEKKSAASRDRDSIIAQSLAFGDTSAANDADDDDGDIGESTDYFAQMDDKPTSLSVSPALAASAAAATRKPAKPANAKRATAAGPSRRESLLSPANPEAAFQVCAADIGRCQIFVHVRYFGHARYLSVPIIFVLVRSSQSLILFVQTWNSRLISSVSIWHFHS